MTPHQIYIISVIIVKLSFAFFSVSHIYYYLKGKADSESDKTAIFWKERLEFLFIILMSILVIYTFNPLSKKEIVIKREAKILMFVFGIVVLTGAKYELFIPRDLYKKTLSY